MDPVDESRIKQWRNDARVAPAHPTRWTLIAGNTPPVPCSVNATRTAPPAGHPSTPPCSRSASNTVAGGCRIRNPFTPLQTRAGTLGKHLRVTAVSRPFTLPLGTAAVVVGSLALVYGAAVSAALSVILPESVAPANTIARFWGLIQIIGGIQVLRGVLTPRLDTERSGWGFLIGSSVFYAAGLIGGLGLAGSAAGTYMAALAVGSMLRTWGLKQIRDAAWEAERSRKER